VINLTLPKPPTTNQLYSGRRFKTERYRSWIEDAGWTAKAQRPGAIKGRFQLTIYMPGRADLDNIKAIPDLLKTLGIIEDDSPKFMRRITIEAVDSGDCRIELSECS
jgi:Holliday junction resolvase RusA-like endonuclease